MIFKDGNLYYNYKDLFQISAYPEFETNDKIRLQIINSENNVIIEKLFLVQDTDILPNGQYVIELSESESDLLKLDMIYVYRLSFVNSENKAMTSLSGYLIVEW